MVLNWSALQMAVVYETPYRWILFEDIIATDAKFELMNSYPSKEQFRELGEGDISLAIPVFAKQEVVSQLREINEHWRSRVESGIITSNIPNCNEIWQRFFEELWSLAYLKVMGKLSGLKLENCLMTIGFRRFHSGHAKFWVPHTDGSHRVLTHLFYFNEEWSNDWGGCLQILLQKDTSSVVYSIPPLIGSSVALVETGKSWHVITPISPQAPQHRLTMQTVFWLPSS
ncbi:2OG-Fe(II) oxygenase family protein [Scytonema sp. NUACC26]|uniref:2OG-Fe(II) oxygenase family protein n=1 Tax=Scytonema sp. NUACC26 TaxID=3140176 RepID=UPI0034DBF891